MPMRCTAHHGEILPGGSAICRVHASWNVGGLIKLSHGPERLAAVGRAQGIQVGCIRTCQRGGNVHPGHAAIGRLEQAASQFGRKISRSAAGPCHTEVAQIEGLCWFAARQVCSCLALCFRLAAGAPKSTYFPVEAPAHTTLPLTASRPKQRLAGILRTRVHVAPAAGGSICSRGEPWQQGSDGAPQLGLPAQLRLAVRALSRSTLPPAYRHQWCGTLRPAR